MNEAAVERMLAKTEQVPNGCLLWKGTCNHKGYGQVWVDGKMQLVHRVLYATFVEQIPEGYIVMHSCDEPGCVNPQHLRAGTHRDNAFDRDRKGRGYRGTRHAKARLTHDQVREMRQRYDKGEPVAKLAREFDLSYTGASAVCRRLHWKHVK